jgi:hypothetical protein
VFDGEETIYFLIPHGCVEEDEFSWNVKPCRLVNNHQLIRSNVQEDSILNSHSYCSHLPRNATLHFIIKISNAFQEIFSSATVVTASTHFTYFILFAFLFVSKNTVSATIISTVSLSGSFPSHSIQFPLHFLRSDCSTFKDIYVVLIVKA